MSKKPLIIIVEDNIAFNNMVSAFLRRKEIGNIKSFFSGNDCIRDLNETPKIMFLDYEMPGMNGIEVMKEIKLKYPGTIFIFLSGQHDIAVSIEALKQGAYDYIVKDEFAKENAHFKAVQALCFEKTRYEHLLYKKGFYLALLLMIVFITYVLIISRT